MREGFKCLLVASRETLKSERDRAVERGDRLEGENRQRTQQLRDTQVEVEERETEKQELMDKVFRAERELQETGEVLEEIQLNLELMQRDKMVREEQLRQAEE